MGNTLQALLSLVWSSRRYRLLFFCFLSTRCAPLTLFSLSLPFSLSLSLYPPHPYQIKLFTKKKKKKRQIVWLQFLPPRDHIVYINANWLLLPLAVDSENPQLTALVSTWCLLRTERCFNLWQKASWPLCMPQRWQYSRCRPAL